MRRLLFQPLGLFLQPMAIRQYFLGRCLPAVRTAFRIPSRTKCLWVSAFPSLTIGAGLNWPVQGIIPLLTRSVTFREPKPPVASCRRAQILKELLVFSRDRLNFLCQTIKFNLRLRPRADLAA
jgi:hypothetical protein